VTKTRGGEVGNIRLPKPPALVRQSAVGLGSEWHAISADMRQQLGGDVVGEGAQCSQAPGTARLRQLGRDQQKNHRVDTFRSAIRLSTIVGAGIFAARG